MNYYKSSGELKTLAKEKLTGRYGSAIMLIFAAEAINMIASEVVTLATPTNSGVGIVVSLFLTLAFSVVTGVFNVGIAFFFLNAACGRQCTVHDLFYGFREQPNKSLLISLPFALVQFLCLTPYQVFFSLFLRDDSIQWLIFMFLSMALGLLVYVPVSLAISQSFYLMLDFPEKTAKEILLMSIRVMKGHKCRLFYLEVSFIPLLMLSLFTCCVGFLWVIPYMQMTMALFFLDIMNPGSQTHI